MIELNDREPDIVESPLQQEAELVTMPAPELLPTTETQLNESQPEPEYLAASVPEAVTPAFNWDMLAVPKLNNFVPRGTQVPSTNTDGSVIMAYLGDNNTIGSWLTARSYRNPELVDTDTFNPIANLTPDQLPDMVHYALDRSIDDINETTATLARERQRDAIMEAHPWQTFMTGIATLPLEPLNWVTGPVYMGAKAAGSLAKSFAGTGMATMFDVGVQEVALQNTQLTRTVQESVFNVAVSGIIGGALGAGARQYDVYKAAKLTKEQEKRAYDSVMDIIIDPDTPVSPSVGAARVEGVDDALANMPKIFGYDIVKKSMVMSPSARIMASEFKTVNRFGSIFLDNALFTKANTQGFTWGTSLERRTKVRRSQMLPAIAEYNNAFYEMLGINAGPNLAKKVRAAVTKGEMTDYEFSRRVSRVLFNNEPDTNPFVNRGAAALKKVKDKDLDALVEMGYLQPGEGTKTSEGHLMKVYNRQLIVEQGGRNARGEGTFPEAVFNGMKRSMLAAKAFRETPFYVQTKAKILMLKSGLRSKKIKAGDKKGIKAAIKELQQAIKDNAMKFDKMILNKKGKLWKEVDDDTLWEAAIQHVDTILSQDSDTMLNPVLRNFNKPNSLHERVLMISQDSLEPWLIHDAVKLVEMQNRALAPFIEKQLLARELGYKDFDAFKMDIAAQLKREYDEKNFKTVIRDGVEVRIGLEGKAGAKLEKKFEQAKKDMMAVMDLIDGVYGVGENTITSTKLQKFFQNFKTYNYLRMMGNITLTSMNDIGSVMIRNGVWNTIYHGLVPMVSDMRKLSKQDLRALNFGLESEMGLRAHAFMDGSGLTTTPGIFEKSLDAMSSAFGDLTLFNQWTAMGQRLSMVTSINKTLDTIHRLQTGKKVAAKDRTRLAQLGIREDNFEYIFKQTSGPDNISSNGTRVADWTTWEPTTRQEAEALREFQAATAKDIDQTIIQPGVGDKPLFANSMLGSVLLQFKTFAFTTVNKVLYSGIQRRTDAEVYTGTIAMLTLGAMSYAATKYVRGEEPDFEAGNLAMESIDRSGVLGIYMEVFDIFKNMGVIPGEGPTRYMSRGQIGALLGPTFGTAEDTAKVLSNLANSFWKDKPVTTSDVKKILRLFPFQNLAGLVYANEALTTYIGDTLNLVEDRKGK